MSRRLLIEPIRAMISADMTYSQIGAALGVTRNVIASIVHRYIHGHTRPGRGPSWRKGLKGQINLNAETHPNLIEPWVVFSARKQKERAEARAAALSLPNGHADPLDVTGSEG